MHRFSLLTRAACVVTGALSLLSCTPVRAEGEIAFTARFEPSDVRAGETTQVVVEARLKEGWHVYSLTKREGGGPKPLELSLASTGGLEQEGDPIQPPPRREFDRGFKIEVEYYGGAVAFGIPVRVAEGASGKQAATVNIRHQVCKDGACLRPTRVSLPVTLDVAPGAPRPERTSALTNPPAQPEGYTPPVGEAAAPAPGSSGPLPDNIGTQIDTARSRGLLAFLGLAITMGFLALLTPCVFPLVPITVSYFTKAQEDAPGSGVRQALAYCLGIILTFTGVGLVMAAFVDAGAISRFATHPIVNVGLALLFIAMAVNLFGGFEIILPGWLVEKTQAGTQAGGLRGPILMGVTFTLTSFTCTFAFVGTLLALTTRGGAMWSFVGMLAFSTAFASPFFLLALFPQWLSRLPRSGSWLVTVKAYMGFLELAAALKFLSNADLVWQLGFLTRPAFLGIWFAIFLLAGVYLLGGVRLPHDEGPIGPVRRGIGVLTLLIGGFLLMGLNGAPLGAATSLLPPRDYAGRYGAAGAATLDGLEWIEDYDAAVARAKAEGKLLFLDFTGVTCTNCRLMEENVFPRNEVAAELQKFITVRLYTDKDDERSRRYADLQLKRFHQTTLPLYVVLTPEEKELGQIAYEPDPARFLAFLKGVQSRAGSPGGA